MGLPPIPFLYLRHGETAWNAQGLAQGRTDVPLNARGLAQAEEAAETLAGLGVDLIVASPLERAAALGDWYEEWLCAGVTPTGGESFHALCARASQALAPHLVPGRLTLFVAHGALFRGVRALIGQPIDQRLPNGVPFECTPRGADWTVEIVGARQQGA